MSLEYFDVVGTFQALISDGDDAGGDPDTQNISAFIYFEPSTKTVNSAVDHKVYRLETIRGRINVSDGQAKNIDGTTIALVANNAAINVPGLSYKVSFDHVRFNGAEKVMDSFVFLAPTSGADTVDLSTVEHVLP